jgi:hypothetical protein
VLSRKRLGFILYPSSFILYPLSFILRPSALRPAPQLAAGRVDLVPFAPANLCVQSPLPERLHEPGNGRG